MPQIPEYTAQGSASPDDKGIQTAEVAGRRIGAYGHQLEGDVDQIGAQVDQHQTNMEVSHGSAIGATAYSGFTTSLNEVVRNADPNDQSAAPKWKQEVFEPWAQDFVSNFHTKGGQEWARNYTDAMRQHFTEAAISDQSTMAGIAAHQNWQATKVGLASTVYQDSTALNASLSALDASLEVLKKDPSLNGRDLAAIEDERVKARGDLAEAAAGGMIQNGDIAGARKFLNDPATGTLLGDRVAELGERADRQEEFLQRRADYQNNQNQKAAEFQGRSIYGTLDARVQAQLRPGAQPDPSLADDINSFTGKFSSVLPGESASLQAGLTSAASPAKERGLIPDVTPAGTAMISALGTPAAPTDVQISQAEYTGAINHDTAELLRGGLKANGDPVLKADMGHLKAWQEQFRGQIARPGAVGGPTAYNQFVHDSTLQFTQWYQQDPAHAFDIVTNATNPRSFVKSGMITAYARAANYPDPLAQLNKVPGYQHLAGVAEGSVLSPITGPTAATPGTQSAPGPLDAATFDKFNKLTGGH